MYDSLLKNLYMFLNNVLIIFMFLSIKIHLITFKLFLSSSIFRYNYTLYIYILSINQKLN